MQLSLEKCTKKEEIEFFENIVPLFEGFSVYMRFSERESSAARRFNPYSAKEKPPELCGFSMRTLCLDFNLQTLVFLRNGGANAAKREVE